MWIGFDTYEYSCDGGSLMLGNKDFQVAFPNDYGDGRHLVYIGTTGRTVPDTFHGDRVKFVGSIQGEFNVYSYDCLEESELVDSDNILVTLNGRYGVYACEGYMFLEKWE